MIDTGDIKLMFGDCLERMKEIPDGSVDLIVCDLPYGTVKGIGEDSKIDHGMKGKTEWDNVIDTNLIMKGADRVLRKNGKMCLFAQQPFTTELINGAIPNLPFNYSMIWEKDHFANALTAKKAPLNYYEDVLVFSKKNPTHDSEFTHPLRPYFNNVFVFINKTKTDIIKEVGQRVDHTLRFNSSQFSLCTEQTYNELIEIFNIEKMGGFKPYHELEEIDKPFKQSLNNDSNKINPSTFNLWEGKKLKSNILKYKKDYNGFHPTQKPVALIEDLIKTFSNEGNLIADFTMGSGSTGVACVNTGRKFIGIELDPEYYGIACERII